MHGLKTHRLLTLVPLAILPLVGRKDGETPAPVGRQLIITDGRRLKPLVLIHGSRACSFCTTFRLAQFLVSRRLPSARVNRSVPLFPSFVLSWVGVFCCFFPGVDFAEGVHIPLVQLFVFGFHFEHNRLCCRFVVRVANFPGVKVFGLPLFQAR
jgi:hypothetical protein